MEKKEWWSHGESNSRPSHCEHEWGVSFLLVLGGFSITDTVINHLEHLWTGTNAGQILR